MSKDHVLKHLEMIQNIVDRMARCSFWIKGWSVAIVIALLAVIFRQGANIYMYWLIFPILLLGLLDAYYLWQENRFRGTYDNVRSEDDTDFEMKPDESKKYWGVVISITISGFYFILCLLITIVIWNLTQVSPIKYFLESVCNG